MHSQTNLVKSLDDEPVTPGEFATQMKDDLPIKKRRVSKKILLVPLIVILFLVLGVLAVVAALYSPTKNLLTKVLELETAGKAVMPFIQSQDLAGTQNQLKLVEQKLGEVENQLSAFSWLSSLPVVKEYYLDARAGIQAGKELIQAGEIGIAGIAPYADVIGLKGISGSTDGGKTAQDRINFIVNTIDKLSPQLEEIGQKLNSAQNLVSRIDPERYPDQFRGIQIRSQLATGLQTLKLGSAVINDAKPMLEASPYMLGIESPRKYLILFQNDAEIRPTGGFLTGYAVIQVDKGKISTLQSDDIYKLDELFPKRIPAPEPIVKYLPLVPYWYLRDMNLSPDFRTSMETFMANYKLTKSPSVDGVIAVNTQVLVDLLKVTGPIGVPGFGNFSADNDPRCNCPQVFYELQMLAGGEEPVVWDSVSGKIVKAPANYGNRKAFLGPMMFSILSNVMAQPKNKMPELFNTALNQVAAKNVLVYFFDENAQLAAEKFNMAGRVRDTKGDYLAIIDTNFAGAKTNIWVTYKADQKITINDKGEAVKKLTITYSNPQQKAVKITEARNLNGQFRNWLRVYVPKGSQLIKADGFESGQTTGEDLGKTVFEGFFSLLPGNTRQITLEYKLPGTFNSPFPLLMQKQGGSKAFPYTVTINNTPTQEYILNSDLDVSLSY